MFTPQFFPEQYFAPQYFPPALGLVLAEYGGAQFGEKYIAFVPLQEMLLQQIPVDANVLEYTKETDTEFVIDGKKYELVEQRTPSEIIREYKKTEELLDDIIEKTGLTRRKAKKELYNEIIETLNQVEEVKESVFQDDEEIIMILMATDDL